MADNLHTEEFKRRIFKVALYIDGQVEKRAVELNKPLLNNGILSRKTIVDALYYLHYVWLYRNGDNQHKVKILSDFNQLQPAVILEMVCEKIQSICPILHLIILHGFNDWYSLWAAWIYRPLNPQHTLWTSNLANISDPKKTWEKWKQISVSQLVRAQFINLCDLSETNSDQKPSQDSDRDSGQVGRRNAGYQLPTIRSLKSPISFDDGMGTSVQLAFKRSRQAHRSMFEVVQSNKCTEVYITTDSDETSAEKSPDDEAVNNNSSSPYTDSTSPLY